MSVAVGTEPMVRETFEAKQLKLRFRGAGDDCEGVWGKSGTSFWSIGEHEVNGMCTCTIG